MARAGLFLGENMRRTIALMGMVLIAVCALWAGEAHRLTPTPKTVAWGWFDPQTPPALRVHSGDTVDIEALAAGGSDVLIASGLPREQIQPALFEIERAVKDRGEVPHILTGPVYVEGAEPGDVLEVKILSIDLVVPYAWNTFRPGRGYLPDEFPYAQFK